MSAKVLSFPKQGADVKAFVALDVLVRATDYLQDQFDASIHQPGHFEARQILLNAMSRVLDQVSV